MEKKSDYLVVCVESRKGGVGKTTAALNLASILLKEKYIVLLLDIDITGTNISDGLQSPFWRNLTNPLKINNEYANLLRIFQDKFMQGDVLPNWTGKGKNSFSISENKINIIGSQIDDKHFSNETSFHLCNPSILFDELHSFWFVEFLQTISDDFSKKYLGRKVAIVLDNSPGYIGINPAIQNWITDIGPKRGKFLIITSLDIQDLVSCNGSIDRIQNLYFSKIEASNKYLEIINEKKDETDYDLDGKSDTEYLRIITDNISEDFKKSYLQKNGEENKIADLNSYMAVVVNKVPIEIKQNRLTFDFNKHNLIDSNNNSDANVPKDPKLKYVMQLLGETQKENKKLFVYYNNLINFEFKNDVIMNKSRRRISSKSKINIVFNDLINETSLNASLIANNKDILNIQNIRLNANKIKHYQSLIDELKLLLNNRTNDFLQSSWTPMGPFEELGNIISDISNSLDNLSQRSDYQINNLTNREIPIELIIDQINTQLIQNISTDKRNNYSNLVGIFSISLLTALYRSQIFISSNSKLWEVLLSIINLQIDRITKSNINVNDISTLYEILRTEKIDDNIWNQNMESSNLLSRDYLNLSKVSNQSELYDKFSYAQLRFLKMEVDLSFLVEVLKYLTMDANRSLLNDIIFPRESAILEEYLIDRSIDYKMAELKLSKDIEEISYMIEFKNVIGYATKQWGFHKE